MNRRFIVYSVCTASLVAALLVITTACSTSPKPCPDASPVPGLAVAVGNRSNSATPAWPSALDGALDAVAQKYDPNWGATLIQVDGQPSVSCVITVDTSGKNPPAKTTARDNFTATVRTRFAQVHSSKPEADPLAALGLASRSAGPGGTVVLDDSGIQTKPPLDFTKDDLLNADVQRLVAQLDEAGDLPDLSGQHLILVNLGETASPQSPLGEAQRTHLIELWNAIVSIAGASSVTIVSTPDTTPAPSGRPRVTPVKVRPATNPIVGCNTETVLPDDGPVGFRPNSTAFVNDKSARAALTVFAKWLAGNPQGHATLTGSVAHYRPRTGSLSLARADRVRAVLISLGATANQISTVGIGWGPIPTTTAPPDNTSDPLNRRVIVRLTC